LLRFPLPKQVITTWYRAPEVLLGHRYYDPSVDVWSAVCIIAGNIAVHVVIVCAVAILSSISPLVSNENTCDIKTDPFRFPFSQHSLLPAEMSNRRVLFHGFKSDIDQIHTIFRLLGTPTPDVWPGLEDIPYWRQTFPVWPARSVASLVPNMSPDGADFMSRVLRYDARSRMSAKAALQHPYLRNFVQSPMSAARALRAPQVSSGQAHLGAYSIAQAQAGLSGAGLPASAAVHVENVPVVSLFNSGAALASRCSSAVSFLDDSFTSTGYAPSVNGEDSNSGLFQPISSGDLASATAAASTSSAAAGAMSAPRPSARSASTTASTTRAAAVVSTAVPAAPVVPVAVLPRAARPVESQAVQAANEHRAAFAAVTSGARAAAASSQPATASAQSGAPVQAQIPVSRSSNRLNADIVAEAVPQSIPAPITVTLPIPVQARVQVPVVAAASSRSVSSMRGTAAESHAGKPAAAAPSSAPSAAVRRTTQVVTEDSAAELFEPLRTHSRAKKTAPTSAKELRARGLSTDSTSSIGLSGINTALEGDLDSSMEWGEDSQDGHAFTSSGENNKTAPVTQAGASAAAAAQNKGRFNKRKFGSPLPSRPASAVFFSNAAATVPASAEVTAVVPDAVTTESAPAPQAARTRKRRAEPLLDGDSHLSLSVDIAPAPTKYAKVTPEAAAAGSGGRDELYWGAGSGDTPAGKVAEKQTGKDEKNKAEKGKAAAKAPTAVAVVAAAPVVAAPVRRSTRGAK
jgi:hypothetical protein